MRQAIPVAVPRARNDTAGDDLAIAKLAQSTTPLVDALAHSELPLDRPSRPEAFNKLCHIVWEVRTPARAEARDRAARTDGAFEGLTPPPGEGGECQLASKAPHRPDPAVQRDWCGVCPPPSAERGLRAH